MAHTLTQNQYNTCDSSAFTFESFWPRLAGWYGVDYTGPAADEECTAIESPYVPRGYGPKGVTRRKFKMSDWAKKDEVETAWGELAKEYGLTQKELVDVDRVFGFLDGTLGRHSPLNMRYMERFIHLLLVQLTLSSMDKARKLGFHGFVDSSESFLEVFDDLAKLKMIPPVPKVKVSFN